MIISKYHFKEKQKRVSKMLAEQVWYMGEKLETDNEQWSIVWSVLQASGANLCADVAKESNKATTSQKSQKFVTIQKPRRRQFHKQRTRKKTSSTRRRGSVASEKKRSKWWSSLRPEERRRLKSINNRRKKRNL